MSANLTIAAQICLAGFAASILALSAHIFLQHRLKNILERFVQQNVQSVEAGNIISWAYVTALLQGLSIALIFYAASPILADLLKIIQILVTAVLSLEARGQLLRQPIMNYLVNRKAGMKHPFCYVLINQIDQWTAALLMAFCLVYLCPRHNYSLVN